MEISNSEDTLPLNIYFDGHSICIIVNAMKTPDDEEKYLNNGGFFKKWKNFISINVNKNKFEVYNYDRRDTALNDSQ